MTPDELCFTPATELVPLIRRRKVSPLELMKAVLARIERVNPPLNAYCTLAADQALAAARKATAALGKRGATLGPVIVAATIDVAAAIIAESTLSFLGLGFPPDIPTWGRLLADAKDYLDMAPHWAMASGMAIFLTVLSINFIGDGLRDALDPRRVI